MGSFSLLLEIIFAPIIFRGVRILPIGLLLRDASPFKLASILEPIIAPRMSLAPVPELPRSRYSVGSLNPKIPTPFTNQYPFDFSIFTPNVFSAFIVAKTSSLSSRPLILDWPIHILDIISALWEIDLSPGTFA